MTARPEDKNWTETVDNLAAMDLKQDVEEAAFIEKTDEEKKLVRKIDMYLMPTIWVLYCFSYMVSVIFSLGETERDG
jgi:citrate synthase